MSMSLPGDCGAPVGMYEIRNAGAGTGVGAAATGDLAGMGDSALRSLAALDKREDTKKKKRRTRQDMNK